MFVRVALQTDTLELYTGPSFTNSPHTGHKDILICSYSSFWRPSSNS